MKVANFATPINRIGFVVFCIGALLLVVSLLATVEFRYDGPHIANIYELLFLRERYWWQSTFRIGLPMAFFGAWFAWFYEPTVGRLIRWIRLGSSKDPK